MKCHNALKVGGNKDGFYRVYLVLVMRELNCMLPDMEHECTNEDKLLAELRQCEINVWEALVKGDVRADEASLHDDFLGVYSDGFADKADHVQQLRNGPTITSYDLSELRVLQLGNDHAVLSYRADFLRKEAVDPEAMYVSSIWRRVEQGWTGVFSQDTVATG